MAGRGRGKAAIAAFPKVRHQLRRPKEELLAVNGSSTEQTAFDGTPQKSSGDTPDSDDLKKLCFRLKYLSSSSDADFTKTMDALKVALKTKNDASSASEYMHELSQLGPDQAKITAFAFVDLADFEIEGSKIRNFLLNKMQADFEGFKVKLQQAPNALLCNATFLCEVYCRYLISGAPLKPLQGPAWEYLNFMLRSQQPFFIKHSLQIVEQHGSFLSKHGDSEMASFLDEVRSLILEEGTEKHVRKQALKTLESSLSGWKPCASKFYSDVK